MVLALKQHFHAFGNVADPVLKYEDMFAARQGGESILDFVQPGSQSAQGARVYRRAGQFVKALQNMGIAMLERLQGTFHVRPGHHGLQIGNFLADVLRQKVVVTVDAQTLHHVGQTAQFGILLADPLMGAAGIAAERILQGAQFLTDPAIGLFLRLAQGFDPAAEVPVDMDRRIRRPAAGPSAWLAARTLVIVFRFHVIEIVRLIGSLTGALITLLDIALVTVVIAVFMVGIAGQTLNLPIQAFQRSQHIVQTVDRLGSLMCTRARLGAGRFGPAAAARFRPLFRPFTPVFQARGFFAPAALTRVQQPVELVRDRFQFVLTVGIVHTTRPERGCGSGQSLDPVKLRTAGSSRGGTFEVIV